MPFFASKLLLATNYAIKINKNNNFLCFLLIALSKHYTGNCVFLSKDLKKFITHFYLCVTVFCGLYNHYLCRDNENYLKVKSILNL